MKYRYLVPLWLISVVGAYGAGYYLHDPEIVTNTDIVEVEKIVTRTVTVKDTKPDGSSSERVETTKTETKILDDTSRHVVSLPPPKNNWSLGASIAPVSPPRLDWYTPTQITIGRRILGDFWIEAGFNNHKEVLVGIRYEF